MSDGHHGVFVTIDGPKRSGKTSLRRELVRHLLAERFHVLMTKEPTAQFDLATEEAVAGEALAQKLAEDRRRHCEGLIMPALAFGATVIADRYVASGLVFQAADGVPTEHVLASASGLPLPDLALFVMADEASLDRRRPDVAHQTRLEQLMSHEAEVALYRAAADVLQARGSRVVFVDNSDSVPMESAVTQAVSEIEALSLGAGMRL